MTLTKAYIEPEAASQMEKLDFMFNPENLTLTQSNCWEAATQAGSGPRDAKFMGSNSSRLDFGELLFDTTDTGKPVTLYTDKLLKLLEINTNLPGPGGNNNNNRPPYVRFGWGDMKSFPVVITEASVKLIFFSKAGTPLRAVVSLSLMQYMEEPKWVSQNPTSGTPRPHRVHRATPGESIDRIAATHYGRSNDWRAIALANGIEDPMTIRPGKLLAIPQLVD